MEIIPAILTNNPQELKQKINLTEDLFHRVQIDIIDGVFAENKTIDPTALKYIDTNLLLDFQLMTKEPISWVEKCASAGADRIIGHIEMMTSQREFVSKVQEVGSYVGLGLDLSTSIEQLDESLIKDLDVILLMSTKAGHGGQEFDGAVLQKIVALNKLQKLDDNPFKICVDGGVNVKNIHEIVSVGANEVAIGKSLLLGDISKNLDLLEEAIE